MCRRGSGNFRTSQAEGHRNPFGARPVRGRPEGRGKRVATFLFVHGAWHGAWFWEPILAPLHRGGHQTKAVDLPGHGADPTPLAECTLARYVEQVVEALEALPSQSVILVGHSMGGMVVSEVAERCAERIRWLVYVAAFLPRDGERMVEMMAREPGHAPLAGLTPVEGGVASRFSPEQARALFYNRTPAALADAAVHRLGPEPVVIRQTPVRLSDRFAKVPRCYVEAVYDRAIPLTLQRRMQAATPCQRVHTLLSDHSVPWSAPMALAAVLRDLGG
jgi:pimeloyl-ACP methyl ester carboxylesterase